MTRSPPWLHRAFGPFASYLDMLFVDHGVFRVVYLNKHRLGQEAWRSAQPTPQQVAAFARQGIKTVVNLRGERLCGSYWLERAACLKHGLKLVNYQVRSRAAPSRQEVLGARDLFQRIQYPMIMHCKSGADRAGLMSVLYLHFHEGLPIEQALKALSLRYGHIRQADTGVLDYFFERYLTDNAKSPMSFVTWLETVYDPEELLRTYKSKGWANLIVNRVLRRE
ncbi:MAG: protein tyrosine phosphatase [Hyphomicrobiaceae bacterium]|nr:protein tyrosine phosphatase [Hyphomicrobiaceae bacterium]